MRINKIKLIILLVLLSLTITACKTVVTKYEETEKNFWDKFIIIEERGNAGYGSLYLVYDKDTLVEYYISSTYDGRRVVSSPVYNNDGTIKIYDKESEE